MWNSGTGTDGTINQSPFIQSKEHFITPSHSADTYHIMTTLNPSHDPFRKSEGRHAQAVRQSSQYPDNLPVEDNESIDGDGPSRAKREARRRVRQQMPPMPDLRFEQVSLLLKQSASTCTRSRVLELAGRRSNVSLTP
jgi:hypothetical protein